MGESKGWSRRPVAPELMLYPRLVFVGNSWNGTPCLEYGGSRNDLGYGRIRKNARDYYAHRFAYEWEVGPIPEGLVIDHLCSNPPCCNVDHLEAVTQAENMRRGRGLVGDIARERRAQTHCFRGHEYTPETTSWHRSGRYVRRVCNVCRKILREEAKKRREQSDV